MKIRKELNRVANSEKAKILQRFFKTGPGEYGEGDVFLGVVVPVIRQVAKVCQDASLTDIQVSLRSEIHEERLCALVILSERYHLADKGLKKEIFDLYLKNLKQGRINNWDLVDLSAPRIVGRYLLDKPKAILYRLAKSKNLWERRVAVISTLYFITEGEYTETLKVAEILLDDEHDLIHKAVGWMLREVGKRNLKIEEKFLKKHYKKMPRTMLRYAIEKFPEGKRRWYLER